MDNDKDRMMNPPAQEAGSAGILIPLNGYLVRASASPRSAFTATTNVTFSLFTPNGLAAIEEPGQFANPEDGTILIARLERVSPPPIWQVFAGQILGIAGYDEDRPSRGLAVFVAVTDFSGRVRWIAWTFGTASRSINRRAIDPRFGLITTLNSLARPKGDDVDGSIVSPAGHLQGIEYRTPSVYAQRTAHRSAKDTPLNAFRFDRLLDVASAVSGRAVIQDQTSQVFGSRSVRLRAQVEHGNQLVALGQELLDLYHQRYYVDDYGWIENYVLVDDELLEEQLRTELLRRLVTEPDSVDTLVPDDLIDPDLDRSVHFVAFPYERRKQATSTALTSRGLARYVDEHGPEALDARLSFLDINREVIGDATIAECLSAELTHVGQRYVAYDGFYFRVNADFLRTIDEQIRKIPLTTLSLDPWKGGREDEWCQDIAADHPDSFVCLDKKLIRLTGETPFEGCDLLHKSGRLVFAKRLGKSSMLTYVFTQLERSCELLNMDGAARTQLRAHIENECPDPDVAAQMIDAVANLERRPCQAEVVVAFLGEWRNRDITRLPLISKVSLVAAFHRLEQKGYRPSIALVDLVTDQDEQAA